MTTDRLMPDVLRSCTMAPGELCAMMALTIPTHKSPAICSDLGKYLFLDDDMLNRRND